MAARAVASGTISFGLVSIPVKLFTAASSEQVSFNMLHKACGTRVKMQYICPTDNQVAERSDTIKGYEHARGQYVLFSEEELKAVQDNFSQVAAEAQEELEEIETRKRPARTAKRLRRIH